MSNPDPSAPSQFKSPDGTAAPAAKKPLPWRVPSSKPKVAATPSCNPNYRPPAPGK